MRKHFLLLFLLALLPLAGWAADITFDLNQVTYDYTGADLTGTVKGQIDNVTLGLTDLNVNDCIVGFYSDAECSSPATPQAVGTYWVKLSYDDGVDVSVSDPQSFAIVADVTVTLYDFTIPYGAEPTAATLKTQYPSAVKVEGATWDQIKEYLTFARVDDGSTNWNSNNVGVYSWTLTKALNTGGYTIYLSSNNAKLTIEKATITESTPGALAANCTYGSLQNPLQLVTTAPTISLAEAQETIEYSLDQVNWSTTKPSIKKVAVHHVYYRVPGTSNWNAKASTEIGTVEITGTVLTLNTDYTAPALVEGALSFQWDAVNGKAVEQTLITAGTTPTNHGTLYYCVDGGEWSTELPTASAAGNHTVSWKVVGDEGYYDVAPANLTAKNIAAVAPTVYSATAASSLEYTGAAQELLSEAGSATLGATPTYSVKYATTNLDDWTGVLATPIENSADVKGTDAGFYQVTTLVATGSNYVAAAATPIVVQIGTKAAFTDAPTAADLTWNNAAQQLIVAGAGTVEGKVKYSTDNTNWSEDITTITGTNAADYTVWYKVDAANYTPVASTPIANVKIKKKVMSVKVNDATKVYDSGTSLATTTVDGGGDAFTFIGRINDGLNAFNTFNNVTVSPAYDYRDRYAGVDIKNAGEHNNALTIDIATLTAISNNYDYTVIPGKLTITQAPLTITANLGLHAEYGAAYDISNEYYVTGLQGTDALEDVFTEQVLTKYGAFQTGKKPVLTTTAAASKPEPDTYPIAFTKGTLKANGNYKMSDAGDGGYVIPAAANFVVNPDANSKIVITVLPKTQVYTGVAEDWSNMNPNTDYYVTGLIGTDVLTKAPTFSRSDATNYNVGTYTLTASGAEIDESIADRYPGGIIYNNSTFTITAKELVATVNQQTVKQGFDGDLDQTAWSVEGLVGPDATSTDLVTTLGGSLTYEPTATSSTGLKANAIVLAITNTNYKLKAGTNTGDLLVISTTDFALDPTDVNLPSKLAVADGQDGYSIVFTNKTTTIGEWYAMVLPFDVDPLKMVQAFNRYVIFNVLNTATTDDGNFKFTLTMDKIPAGTPFLIKFAKKDNDAANQVVNWATDFKKATYGTVTIEQDITDTETEYVDFTGTYTAKNLQGLKDDNGGEKVWWLAQKAYKGDNNWKKPKTNMHTAAPMEAYLTAEGKTWTSYAPNITVEDFDGSVTAIKSLSADEIHGLNVKGMYNLNGMKMNNVPTQKGVYIVNGKKVVIK